MVRPVFDGDHPGALKFLQRAALGVGVDPHWLQAFIGEIDSPPFGDFDREMDR
jgi:hypothetical protein